MRISPAVLRGDGGGGVDLSRRRQRSTLLLLLPWKELRKDVVGRGGRDETGRFSFNFANATYSLF